MILSIILALLLGILIGALAGLIPGLHPNLFSLFVLSSLTLLLSHLQALPIVVFLTALTITHTIFAFIPSIFLSAPDSDSALSVLPGHKLLNKGEGYEALVLSLYGCFIGLIIFLIFSPIFILIIPKIYFYLKFIMFFLLVFVNLYLILTEKNSRLLSLLIFLLSGFLGFAVFSLPLKESLLPLLTGLFGSSSLLISLSKKQQIPKQEIKSLKKIKLPSIFSPSLASFLTAPLCALLPALGTGQAALLASSLTGENNNKQFIFMLGIINILVISLFFPTLYAINEARAGSIVAIQKIMPQFSLFNLILIIMTILFSVIISLLLALFVSKIIAKNISKINYRMLSLAVLLLLALIVIIFSGWLGFLVFLISSILGLFTILANARRTLLMGSLMLPSIAYYFPF